MSITRINTFQAQDGKGGPLRDLIKSFVPMIKSRMTQIKRIYADFYLKIMLRVFGATSLFALIFVAAPYSWMHAIHSELGMGTLPDAPVVGYLARSTSAFYALLGGLFLLVSFDLARYRMLLNYLGIVITIFGVALLSIDWIEGMPFFWKLWEGPIVTAFGLAIFFLNRANKSENGLSP